MGAQMNVLNRIFNFIINGGAIVSPIAPMPALWKRMGIWLGTCKCATAHSFCYCKSFKWKFCISTILCDVLAHCTAKPTSSVKQLQYQIDKELVLITQLKVRLGSGLKIGFGPAHIRFLNFRTKLDTTPKLCSVARPTH